MPDYMFMLESRLSPEQRELLTRVQEIGSAHETNVYLSGGAVRDLVTGMPIRDMDFTVEGNPARMARELEKRGARVLQEDERRRHMEMVFPGQVDLSLSAARDEIYAHPGAKPESCWATVMEDLRRRDFSINAIAISLNPASLGLLLDPTNGLADVEKREVRVLSMHSFTNQPIRLLRILRYTVRLDFKLEPRTAEWFALAMERKLDRAIEGEAVGDEVRQLAREEKCPAILKVWEARGLIEVIHPRLAKRHPDYDGLMALMKAREWLLAARIQPRLFAPVTHYLLGRLSSGERAAALRKMELRAAEAAAVKNLEKEARKVLKTLKGRKTASPRDAFYFLEEVPAEILAFVLAEFKPSKAVAKIRQYLTKWRPLRAALPVGELEALGVERGGKFDKILQDLFHLQLMGKGRNPQDRVRLLRQLAGIKPESKKKEKEPKKKGKEGPAEAQEKTALGAAGAKSRVKKAPLPTPAELEGEAEPAAAPEPPPKKKKVPAPAAKKTGAAAKSTKAKSGKPKATKKATRRAKKKRRR